jgi:hypothetical protein
MDFSFEQNKTSPGEGTLEPSWGSLILGSKQPTRDRMENNGHWFWSMARLHWGSKPTRLCPMNRSEP